MADVGTTTNTPPTTKVGADRPEEVAQRLWHRTRDSVQEMTDNLDLEGRVRREPYKMIAIAAGVGYVLAGGLVSPLTGRVVGLGLRLGLRVVAVPLLQAALMSALWNRIQGNGSDADSPSSRRKAQPRAETQESQQEKSHERTSTKRS